MVLYSHERWGNKEDEVLATIWKDYIRLKGGQIVKKEKFLKKFKGQIEQEVFLKDL